MSFLALTIVQLIETRPQSREACENASQAHGDGRYNTWNSSISISPSPAADQKRRRVAPTLFTFINTRHQRHFRQICK